MRRDESGGGVDVVTVDDVEIFVSSHTSDTSLLVCLHFSTLLPISQPSHKCHNVSDCQSLVICSFMAEGFCGIFFFFSFIMFCSCLKIETRERKVRHVDDVVRIIL